MPGKWEDELVNYAVLTVLVGGQDRPVELAVLKHVEDRHGQESWQYRAMHAHVHPADPEVSRA